MSTVAKLKIASSVDELDNLIRFGAQAPEPFAQIVDVTPDMAKHLLQFNEMNRPLAKDKMLQYANDMREGRFEGLNGQTIVVSRGGLLNDGQNRLSAVIQSGVSIRTFVIFGAKREHRMTLDQGKSRTTANFLQMSGVEDAKIMSATGSIIIAYSRGDLVFGNMSPLSNNISKWKKGRPTKVEIHQFVESNLDLLDECVSITAAKEAKNVMHHQKLAAAMFILIKETRRNDDVSSFFTRLIMGYDLPANDPILVCRNRLIAEKATGGFKIGKTLELIFKAWNAHVRGESLSRYKLVGELPEILK